VTTLADLATPWPAEVLPRLDRPDTVPADDFELAWQLYGAATIDNAVPAEAIDGVRRAWLESNGPTGPVHFLDGSVMDGDGDWRPGGWPDCTPYMRHPGILDALAPLAGRLESMFGEPMGVHLNLTGWVSTQRDWHQDGYLNPDTTQDYYAAVWLALDDIHADAGPFQWVPGSHRTHDPIRQDAMLDALGVSPADHTWPKQSERILTPMFEAMYPGGVEAHAVDYLPRTGDALIWHARTLHRGSPPKDRDRLRPALIAHFSGIHHRPDMPPAVQHPAGGWYFPINGGPIR
jgi:hypothetical protein